MSAFGGKADIRRLGLETTVINATTGTELDLAFGRADYTSRSIDVNKRPAIDRERNAGDETCLVGRQKQGGVGDIPGGAHLVAQRRGRRRLRRGFCR